MNYIDEVKINLFISTLKKCTKGSIMITDPSGEIVKINNNSEVTADIKINDWSIINNLIKNGDVGFASDYRDGKWSSTNLKDLFTFVIINDKTLSRLLFGQIITRFFSNIKYYNLTSGFLNIPLESLSDYEILLITGIANPAPLASFLKAKANKVHHLIYSDHHHFSSKEIDIIITKYAAITSEKKILLTTEKDYMRLSSKISSLSYLEMSTNLFTKGLE